MAEYFRNFHKFAEMLLKRLCIFFITLSGFLASARQPVRPVTSAWMAEAGSSHQADTYLSPLRYGGWHVGLCYDRMQAMKRTSLIQGWTLRFAFDRGKNQARNAAMLGATVNAAWRILYRQRLPHRFSFGVGGYAGAEFGAMYLSRNGNNPAQAIGSVDLGPEAFIQWNSHIKRMPLAVRWQVSSPVAGAFFCPDYGQLYYEIQLGNRSNLVHFGWPGSRRQIRSLLSVDFNFGRSTLRLGYRFDATSAKANNIVSRRISHAAVVGVVCDLVTLNPRAYDSETVAAYY